MDSFAIGFKLTSLWKEVLSVPPPANSNELWKEHIQIRSLLAEVIVTQRPFIRPDRTKKLENFLNWSNKMGIRHQGVEITNSAFGYLSLAVSKEFDKEALIVEVPRQAVLSLDFADQCFPLRAIFENDEMIKAMDNVGLVMVLAHEVLSGEESAWSAYLNILPDVFSTPIFYSLEQLQTLKPSPIFEEAMNMYRSVARQFVYFYLRILGDSKHVNKKTKLSKAEKAPFSLGPFTADNFSFDFYRWCVSVVSTRINMVPSTNQSRNRGKLPLLVPSLIPFIDLANHDHSANNSGSIFFDSESNAVHLQVHTALQPNQEVLIYYGVRSNLKFLLHNGFVPPLPNPDNTYAFKIGLPKSPGCEFKKRRLEEFGIQPCGDHRNSVYMFVLDPKSASQNSFVASALWQFARTFVAQTPEELDDHNGVQLELKAAKFLTDRFQLILLGYRDLPENEPEGDGDTDSLLKKSVWRLKKSEKEILQSYLVHFSKYKNI